MEFKTCEAITEALTEKIEHGIFGYAYIPQSYYDAFFDWMENRHGMPMEKEWVRLATGVVGALYWFVNCYTKPGDAVIIMTPVYYPFHNAVKPLSARLWITMLKCSFSVRPITRWAAFGRRRNWIGCWTSANATACW